MVKRFLGASIAVKADNFDAAVNKYSAVFGLEPTFVDEAMFAFPGLKGASFRMGDSTINLLTGSADTAVAKFCERRGEGVFLLVCEVDDVAPHMKRAAMHGVRLTTEEPLAFRGGLAAYAHPKSMHGVQWEFFSWDKGLT